MAMEIVHCALALCYAFATTVLPLILLFGAMNMLWIRPKMIERKLRKQGLKGNPYEPFLGDAMKLLKATKQPLPLPGDDFSDAELPGVMALFNRMVEKYGKVCFLWFGPSPCLLVTAPDLIKEILFKREDFQKPNHEFSKLLMVGLISHEGETWTKHRKILNPAFHLDKLKDMLDAMYLSCSKMSSVWEEMIPKEGSIELDVWPFLMNLSGDVISRAAFHSNHEEGIRIFELIKEHVDLVTRFQALNYIPGWRFFPMKTNRRAKQLCKEVEALLTKMIDSRKTELETGGCHKGDLLGALLESNMTAIDVHGNDKGGGLTTEEVVQECKLFYFAGQETTAALLVWTLILLSKHQTWQERAREEVLQVFGKNEKPHFEGLSRLKVVAMILYEVLRLCPPASAVMRKAYKDVTLGKRLIPKGTELLLPICIVHQDSSIWGKDAKDFNPERFSGGVSKATNTQGAFFPFSTGPRNCIGQNFAILEAKIVLSTILRHFALDQSPTYVHAPYASLTTTPQHGASLLLRKL